LKGFLVLFWCPSGHVSLLCLVLISLDARHIAEFSMHIFPVLCLFFFVQRCCSCLFGRARGYRCCFFVCFMPSSFLAHLDPFVLYEIHRDPLALCIFALVKSRCCYDLSWFDLLCCSVFNLSIFDQFLVVRFLVVIYQSFIWLFQCAIRPCFSSSHLSIFIRQLKHFWAPYILSPICCRAAVIIFYSRCRAAVILPFIDFFLKFCFLVCLFHVVPSDFLWFCIS